MLVYGSTASERVSVYRRGFILAAPMGIALQTIAVVSRT